MGSGVRRLPPSFCSHLAVCGSRPREGVVVRSSLHLGDADVHPVRLPRRTRLPRSVINAASWAGTELKTQAIIAAVSPTGTRVTPILGCGGPAPRQGAPTTPHRRDHQGRGRWLAERVRAALPARCAAGSTFRPRRASGGARTRPDGGATSTSTSTTTSWSLRSTVSSTWRRSPGGRTWSATTTWSSRTARPCSGSPVSRFDVSPIVLPASSASSSTGIRRLRDILHVDDVAALTALWHQLPATTSDRRVRGGR